MAEIEHKSIGTGHIHKIHNWQVTDQTQLTSLSVQSTDINKLALDTTTGRYWRLSSVTPVTFVELPAPAAIEVALAILQQNVGGTITIDMNNDDYTMTAEESLNTNLVLLNTGDGSKVLRLFDSLDNPAEYNLFNYSASMVTFRATAGDEDITCYPGPSSILYGYSVAVSLTSFFNDLIAAAKLLAEERVITCVVAAAGSTFTTGDGKYVFRMPYQLDELQEVRASLSGATTTGTITVNIRKDGTDILSTALTIDATEKTSVTAAVPAVIGTALLEDDSEIAIDIDDIGDGTGTGLSITFIGKKIS